MTKEMRELLDNLATMKAEVRAMLTENKVTDAEAKMEEVRALETKIAIQKELDEQEEREAQTKIENTKVVDNMNERDNAVEMETRAFNKAVLGKNMTEEERGLVEATGEDGGYLVPVQQRTQIEELKRQLIPLKQYCNVIPVGTLSGTMPLEVDSNDELVNFAELTDIDESTIKFGQVKFELGDYGDIIPVSNTLLADETANLTNYVGKRFAKKAVRTENSKIIVQLKTATKKAGADYKAIITALNKDLDPAIAANAMIITNQDGFDYLDQLVDENGRPILTDSLAHEGKKLFKGKLIEVMSNAHLTSTGAKLNFYVGDVDSYLAFFDREAYEVAVSKEAGFTKNATMMRVIERFDVKKVDDKAVVNVEITLAP